MIEGAEGMMGTVRWVELTPKGEADPPGSGCYAVYDIVLTSTLAIGAGELEPSDPPYPFWADVARLVGDEYDCDVTVLFPGHDPPRICFTRGAAPPPIDRPGHDGAGT